MDDDGTDDGCSGPQGLALAALGAIQTGSGGGFLFDRW
jgi:hypothetical protein